MKNHVEKKPKLMKSGVEQHQTQNTRYYIMSNAGRYVCISVPQMYFWIPFCMRLEGKPCLILFSNPYTNVCTTLLLYILNRPPNMYARVAITCWTDWIHNLLIQGVLLHVHSLSKLLCNWTLVRGYIKLTRYLQGPTSTLICSFTYAGNSHELEGNLLTKGLPTLLLSTTTTNCSFAARVMSKRQYNMNVIC